ncbi:MAG: histidine phosphatase family protein [Prochlorococcus sp.]|nr:histidine phosphatase family protein [Prochlorococcaceae cyanobacterium Fu_MAG_50]
MPCSVSVDLFLLRHGIATERLHGLDHPERALSGYGITRTLAVVQQLQAFGIRVDRLLSSPYKRAIQTAELAVQAGLAEGLDPQDALQPGADPWPLIQSLRGRCLLVGHQPDLGDLAARLLGAPRGSILLKKAGLLHLRWSIQARDPAGRAELHALLRPGLLLPSPA